MVTLDYRDYITSLESNEIIMGFDAFHIEDVNWYPEEFKVLNKNGHVYGKFHIADVIRDKNYDIEKLIYKGTFEGRGEWTVKVYNVEYDFDENE